MGQIFHRSANSIARISILLAAVGAGGLFWFLAQMQRSPYYSQADIAHMQPVPFSHAHHVGGLGIDCRYCHTSVEVSSFAGIPPTKTCMNCHSQIWTNAPMLEPVRESFRSGQSLIWTRANDLPDYVYFDHSIHINKGVGCNDCHGPVDRMPLMYPLRLAADGVVLELPSRAGEVSAAARPGVQHALPAAFDHQHGRSGRQEVHRPDRARHLPEEQVSPAERAGHYQLQHMPSLKASDGRTVCEAECG